MVAIVAVSAKSQQKVTGFQKGDLVTFPEFGTVVLVVAERGGRYDAVALRHNNYPFGTLIPLMNMESGWELFSGEVALKQ